MDTLGRGSDTLGGVKVGEGLQMTGDVLGVKPEEYDILAEVTVAEGDQVKAFSYNKRLKAFELTAEVPAASDDVAGGVEIYKGNREFVAYNFFGQIVSTKNILCVINSAVLNGKSVVEQTYNQWNSVTTKAQFKGISRASLMTDINKPFTAISLYASAPFPAGTKFQLRGVLADA